MEITTYSFAKRHNSTARPSAGTSMSVQLKELTSFVNPTFILECAGIPSFNYIQMAGNYYWVENITSVRNNIWEVGCGIDVLASWKEEIQSTSAKVLYASSGYSVDIIDTRDSVFVPTDFVDITAVGSDTFWNNAGCYVMHVISARQSSSGFTTTYVLDRQAVGAIATLLLQDTAAMEELKLYFASAFECVVDCFWLPHNVSFGNDTTVKLGDFDTGVSGRTISATATDLYNSRITPPWRNNFTDSNQFTVFKLYLPCVGVVDLSPEDFMRGDITIFCALDCNSGAFYYRIDNASGNIVATYTGNAAAQQPVSTYKREIGQTVNGFLSTAESGISTATSIANFDATRPAGFVGDLLNNLGRTASNAARTAMTYQTKTPSMVGGYGGVVGVDAGNQAKLYTRQVTLTEFEDIGPVLGRPVMRTARIGGFSGYVQTTNASVSAAAPEPCINMINEFLDSGIYLE